MATKYANRMGRAALYVTSGVALGSAAACAAVNYRWNTLKGESTYTDVVRDGFTTNNYIRHSFVAGQVRESMSRRRASDEASYVLWLAQRLQSALDEAERREIAEEMDFEEHISARESCDYSRECDGALGGAICNSVFLQTSISDMVDYNSPSDENFVQALLKSTPSSVRNFLRSVIDSSLEYLPTSASQAVSENKGVAHCRQRLDTPEYLVPYYLRSNLSRFGYYASKKEGGRFKRMNEEEFLMALLGQPKDKVVANPNAASDLFKQFDTNGDGELSFKEFSFLLTLLATPREHYVNGFQMFNQSPAAEAPTDVMKSSLNFEEFCQFIEAKGDDNSKPKLKNIMMTKLFGENGNRRCTLASMLAEVDAFKRKVWRAEFLQHVDPEAAEAAAKKGAFEELSIPTQAVGSLMYDHLLGRHLPFHMVSTLRQLKQYDQKEGSEQISLASWFALSQLMENVDKVGAAVRLYSHTTGRELGREQFARAVKCSDLPALSEQELNLLFTLFDTDGDGTISFSEFENLAESRRSFHVKSRIEAKGETREFFFPRLLKCGSQALFSE